MCLASVAFIKEYLARRELDFNFGLANDRLRLAMEASASVGWDFEIKTGRNVMFGDLHTIFGIPSDTHVMTSEEFFATCIRMTEREFGKQSPMQGKT